MKKTAMTKTTTTTHTTVATTIGLTPDPLRFTPYYLAQDAYYIILHTTYYKLRTM